ncbi:hypothetical protein [Deefgea sp. CFH1-16]|uniref:O-linked N-acetylglucosamine transferase family protein n=1 Tax=Deefgea sp. CFH1-16 TaxID=2675457 RepID=UPI0015F3CD16|nr:hypothetical protein [Deefgea sp. CFH1-16]MBM5575406.1 hypothetical protein [Deefgea sp. CFH1-16]
MLIKKEKLTIGFVSGDFRVHPVGYFVESIIREFAVIAENEFELVVYSNHLQQDQITESIRRAVKHFNQVTALSDCQLATKIHDDQVDILIDLSGHTAFNRLPMFAYQAAPIQISWLGCMLTTGLSTMNYYLTDRWMVPAEFEHEYTEKIVRLPDSFLCFTPPKEDIPCSFLPLSKNGYVTFGCFNNLTKINQNVIALWAKILLALPASRLMLKSRHIGGTASLYRSHCSI